MRVKRLLPHSLSRAALLLFKKVSLDSACFFPPNLMVSQISIAEAHVSMFLCIHSFRGSADVTTRDDLRWLVLVPNNRLLPRHSLYCIYSNIYRITETTNSVWYSGPLPTATIQSQSKYFIIQVEKRTAVLYASEMLSASSGMSSSTANSNFSQFRHDSRNNRVVVVLGAQWGDEGKGKIVDMLASQANIVCRCQVSHL